MRVEIQSFFLLYFAWYASRLVNPTLTVNPQWTQGIQGLDLVLLNVGFFHLNRSLRNPNLRYLLTNAQVLSFALQLLGLLNTWAYSSGYGTTQFTPLLQQLKPVIDGVTGLSVLVHSYYIAFGILEWLNVNLFHRRGISVGITETNTRKLV
jgi:hypothetical protein